MTQYTLCNKELWRAGGHLRVNAEGVTSQEVEEEGRRPVGRKKHWGVVYLLCDWDEAVEGPPTEFHRCFPSAGQPSVVNACYDTLLSDISYPMPQMKRLDFYCLSFTFAGCCATLFRYSLDPLRASYTSRTQPVTRKQ